MDSVWNYSEDSSLSVAEGTVFNSSKLRSAISDYPFADDVDDFPTWRQMQQYMEGYTAHFQLRPHVQLSCPVVGLSRQGKEWVVEIRSKDGPPRREYFDKVAVAIGSFVVPKQPTLPGIERFAGRTLHAINFHHPETFKGQRVLLMGLHASAVDIVVSLSKHASQLYGSHRNGVTLVRLDTT